MIVDNNDKLAIMIYTNQFDAISQGNLTYFINNGIKFNENEKYQPPWSFLYGKNSPIDNIFLKLSINALHYAAFLGHTHIVSYFIKKCGGDVQSKANDGSTALHFAAFSGQLMTMKFLIEECNANIEAVNGEGYTPLLNAALRGFLFVIKYLIIERKANVKVFTKTGYSIIDIALFNNKEYIYKYLTKKLKISPSLGGLGLIQAAKINKLNILKKLYEKEKLDPNKADEIGCTPIFFAVLYGNLEMVQYLIEECKADTNIKLKNGMSVLQTKTLKLMKIKIFIILL